MAIATVNPTTGVTERTFEPHDDAAVDKALAAAHRAFEDFSTTSFKERARLMVGAAELLEGELPVIASVLTTEMGKTFASAKAEVAKCANALRWFAEHAESMLADEIVATSASDSRALFRPLGPVLAVMPWNFPMWQVIRFAAPALDAREHWPAQAFRQRSPDSAPARGHLPACRLSRGRLPDTSDRVGTSSSCNRRRSRESGDPHRF